MISFELQDEGHKVPTNILCILCRDFLFKVVQMYFVQKSLVTKI